jgi:hypothetical protein
VNENPFGGWDPTAMWRMWSDVATKMMQAGTSLPPQAPPPDAARQIRANMLDMWAQSWDQFLRSGPFLEMMKQSMAGTVQARRQMNEFLGEMQHQFQAASRQDIDEIMLSLRHLEQRMVDAVEKMDARLDDLTARLDDGEGPAGPADEEVNLNGRAEKSPLKGGRKRPAQRKVK